MSDYLAVLQELFNSYKKWVSENPQFVSDVETTVKWVSYFAAGRISTSSIVSELIYSLSNILVLFNDRIIQKANTFPLSDGSGHRLKLILTTLEYCEVFIELSSKKLWGEKGRWYFITLVQIVKCIGRFLLMNRYSEEIIQVPPVPALDRKKIANNTLQTTPAQDDFLKGESSFTFKLKRSGRMVRKIEGAPPLHLRNFRPVRSELNTGTKSASVIMKAETLYIMKPLLHLGAIRLFGYRSWKSYSIALLIDIASIRMYYNNREKLSKQQKMELSRRCVNLLLYLVRSPFFEKRSEKKIMSILSSIGSSIPLAKAICNPLMQYIPQWQNTYFYMWST